MDKYPVTPKERTCAAERNHREGLRQVYRQRLLDEQERAQQNSTTEPETDKAV